MNQKNQIKLVSLFVVLEFILCVAVQLATGTLLTVVSFGAIVLAFVFSLITLKKDFNNVLTSFGLLTVDGARWFVPVAEKFMPSGLMFR